MMQEAGAKSNSDELHPGELFARRYLVKRLLGTGGIGSVYEVYDEGLHKNFALKALSSRFLTNRNSVMRFMREGQAASKLISHPNILEIAHYGIEEGRPYIVFELLSGLSLSEMLCANGPIDVSRAAVIFEQIAAGLSYAHNRGIVHRDLKPSNIMLLPENGGFWVKIVDFGIAKMLAESSEGALRLTQAGECIGSPSYMSPEQAAGGNVDARTDIYSFGCLMYETLEGKPPFDGDSAIEVLMKHLKDPPAKLTVTSPSQSSTIRLFDGVISKCLAKQPEQRYQSVAELTADMESISSGQPLAGNGISPKKITVGLLLLGSLLGIAMLLWVINAYYNDDKTRNAQPSPSNNFDARQLYTHDFKSVTDRDSQRDANPAQLKEEISLCRKIISKNAIDHTLGRKECMEVRNQIALAWCNLGDLAQAWKEWDASQRELKLDYEIQADDFALFICANCETICLRAAEPVDPRRNENARILARCTAIVRRSLHNCRPDPGTRLADTMADLVRATTAIHDQTLLSSQKKLISDFPDKYKAELYCSLAYCTKRFESGETVAAGESLRTAFQYLKVFDWKSHTRGGLLWYFGKSFFEIDDFDDAHTVLTAPCDVTDGVVFSDVQHQAADYFAYRAAADLKVHDYGDYRLALKKFWSQCGPNSDLRQLKSRDTEFVDSLKVLANCMRASGQREEEQLLQKRIQILGQ